VASREGDKRSPESGKKRNGVRGREGGGVGCVCERG